MSFRSYNPNEYWNTGTKDCSVSAQSPKNAFIVFYSDEYTYMMIKGTMENA